MKCLQMIRQVDYLSNEVKLIIHKDQTRIQTFFGGCLTIIVILSSLTFGLHFMIQLALKNSIFITSSTDRSSFINVTESYQYPFLLRLTDHDNTPLEYPDKVYSISMKYWYGGSNNSQEHMFDQSKEIKVNRCNLNKHFGKYKYLFINMTDIDTYFCPEIRHSTDIIFGRFDDLYPFGYYHFYISMCLNNDKCLPQDTVKKLTEYIFLDFKTVDFSIHSSQKNVKFETTRIDRHMLSNTVYKRIWFYLNEIHFITDNDLIFTSYEKEVFSQYDSIRYDTDLRDLDSDSIPGTFAGLTILNTGLILSYDRKYLKLVDYLTSMGGMAKFIQICAFLINYVYSYNTYNLHLIDNLYIKHSSNQFNSFNPDVAVFKHLITHKDNKRETNDSKIHINSYKAKASMHSNIVKKLRKSSYRCLPIKFFPQQYKQFIVNCIANINSLLNISNMIMKIEENNLLLNSIIKADKKIKLCCGLNENLPVLRFIKTTSIHSDHNHNHSKNDNYNNQLRSLSKE